MAEFKGKIALDIRDSEPDWAPYLAPKAPDGAPNVLVIAWDDVGFGTMDCFGGPVETPTMTRIADMGVKYANFHTTALCSPTRASLLTGRNATSNGMATIAEFSSGFPGISTRIPFENGFISEVLLEHGYNTYCVGKWHLTPWEETGMAASKRRWPLGRGFERFYGFLGGESSCWYPDLIHDNHPVDPPATPEEGYHIAKDLSDKAIRFIRDAKVVEPEKPFFMYFSLDAAHAPHHVFRSGPTSTRGASTRATKRSARRSSRGRRSSASCRRTPSCRRSTRTASRPSTGPDGQPWPMLDTVRPWDTLSDDEKRLFARMAEVFAGYVSYTDDQVGRVIDFLESSGELDNTIIVVVSDNGASGEGGPNGTFNEWRFFNGAPTPTELTLAAHRRARQPDELQPLQHRLGLGVRHPLPLLEAVGRLRGRHRRHVHGLLAGEGGTADHAAAAVHPRGRRRPDDLRPDRRSRRRRPSAATSRALIEGESFAPSLTDASAPSKTTQFYAMLGQRSIYHEGWLACTLHPPLSGWGKFEQDVWELYDMRTDRSQSKNLAAEHPERLASMIELWFEQAAHLQRAALDDRTALEQTLAERPSGSPPRDRYIYYPDCASVPEQSGVVISGRSYTIAAGVRVDSADAAGCPVRPRWSRRRAQSLHQGSSPALHLQLGRHPSARDRG